MVHKGPFRFWTDISARDPHADIGSAHLGQLSLWLYSKGLRSWTIWSMVRMVLVLFFSGPISGTMRWLRYRFGQVVQSEPLASFQRFVAMWTTWSMAQLVHMVLAHFLFWSDIGFIGPAPISDSPGRLRYQYGRWKPRSRIPRERCRSSTPHRPSPVVSISGLFRT